MLLTKKRNQKYKRSLQKLPGKLRSMRLRARMLFDRVTQGKPAPSKIIAFTMDGGMGDYIMATRTIRDTMSRLPDHTCHVYAKNTVVAKWLTKGLEQCTEVLDPSMDIRALSSLYAAKLRYFTWCGVDYVHTETPAILHMTKRAKKVEEKIGHITHSYPHLDGYLGHYATLMGFKRHNFIHHMVGVPYGGDQLSLELDDGILDELGLTSLPYITVSNGFDLHSVNVDVCSIATKVYPHFDPLIRLIKRKHPEIKVVQMGNTSSTPIPSADINLIGKTTLKQAASILNSSRLHIDNEGGLVHLARAVKTVSCVIFGPTDIDYFGYAENINVPPTVCGKCWWMEDNWMSKCIKGFDKPPCMYEQPAEYVFGRISDHLKGES